MKLASLALLGACGLALAACGSHNHAPVVYGAQNPQTRIYNSPNDIYRKQQLERAQVAQRPQAQRAVVTSDIEPARLTPVSMAALDDPAPPVRQSAPAAEQATHLHKAQGYIEVQSGDTVYAIARRFGVSPQSIIDENDLRAPYSLNIGQALKLPEGAVVAATETPARRVAARDTLYTVRQGDTLYSISRASKVPVDKIASANRMNAPYSLSIGQQIVIPQAPANELLAEPAKRPAQQPVREAEAPRNVAELTKQASYTAPAAEPKSMFEWPIRGAIVSGYGDGALGRRNDGVNIAAPEGTVVRAAADGEVVYRGSELDGFGNLLLVKHAGGYVTAYAHNDAMLVKKGDQVRQGQIIAKVGQTGAVSSPQLHFEIRQNLKSVDPVALLGSQ